MQTIKSDELLCRYSYFLKEKGLSPQTVYSYSLIIKSFLQFNRSLNYWDKNLYYSFFENELTSNKAPMYNKKKQAIKWFYELLYEQESCPLYLFLNFNYKKYYRLPKFNTKYEIAKLNLILQHSNISLKSKIIIQLIITYGLKNKDICRLDLSDYNRFGILSIRKSTENSLKLKLAKNLNLLFIDYLEERYKQKVDHSALFLGYRNNRISSNVISQIFYAVNKRYNLSISARKLRNSFIINSFNHNIQSCYIAAFLGISSISNIQRYYCFSNFHIETVTDCIEKMRFSRVQEDILNERQYTDVFESIFTIGEGRTENSIGRIIG